MAWTTPATWEADQLVTAGDLNAQIRDNLLILAVPIDTSTGKITAINSTCFASLDGTNLTGVAKLASANTFTATLTFDGTGGGRLVLPVGSNKWAT